MLRTQIAVAVALIGCLCLGANAAAEDAFRFAEATFEKGQLRYINGLPVLTVEGTPQEIGRQQGALTAEVAVHIMAHPGNLLTKVDRKEFLPDLLEAGRVLLPQLPKDHLLELKAFAGQADMDFDTLAAVNVMVDAYRGSFGCSSLIVGPRQNDTDGILFGRNLDFFTGGNIQQYSLVTVFRPAGKHAFVSVGFPGMLGCLTGMNDAGLTLAVHEVFFSGDGSSIFNPSGVPYTFAFRRILEECATVEDAKAFLRRTERTTFLSMAVCDRERGAVLEMTPQTVAVRRGPRGITACTNHFRTSRLATLSLGWRYRILMRSIEAQHIDLKYMAAKMHQVNLGPLTMQTMVFEPGPLKLHLAIGSCPSSSLPLKELELAPFLSSRTAGAAESSN
jgi:isopenicillin-N N-acyltransferase-like protein